MADITQHTSIFIKYLNKKRGLDSPVDDEINEIREMDIELNTLLSDAMKIIKNELNSDDPDRRLKAAIAIMQLNNK